MARSGTGIVRVAEVPATILGLARHNVANAIAAGAAARALGATIEQVAEGLRTFQPTADQAPGRLNFYRLGERLVIVDFAHNEAGVNVVLDVAEGLVGRRDERAGRAFLTMIIGTAGDRPDDSLRGIGRIAAERADQVAIKETLRYLRGRTRESMIGEFRDGHPLRRWTASGCARLRGRGRLRARRAHKPGTARGRRHARCARDHVPR